MKPWQTPDFKTLLKLALSEDLGSGDATTLALVSETATCVAGITAKSPLVVAGQWVAKAVFEEVDASLNYVIAVYDGQKTAVSQQIATVSGNTASILAGERTALNFLQRMSGIATAADRFTRVISPYPCRIVDTRKTAPGHRLLDKYAVRMGGGQNHRTNLGDGILIKDNHIKAFGSVSGAVETARKQAPHTLKIQVEVTTVHEATDAIESGADALLLDNMSPETVQQIVHLYGSRAILECSGNITLESIRRYAETGIHVISIGALTHSVVAADISLNII
jgi:nicotinate-nucleotide pyrophosphorylase (carboxylating)